MFIRDIVALALIAVVSGCQRDLAGAPCPCAGGWECCATRNVCIRPGEICPSAGEGGTSHVGVEGVTGGGGTKTAHAGDFPAGGGAKSVDDIAVSGRSNSVGGFPSVAGRGLALGDASGSAGVAGFASDGGSGRGDAGSFAGGDGSSGRSNSGGVGGFAGGDGGRGGGVGGFAGGDGTSVGAGGFAGVGGVVVDPCQRLPTSVIAEDDIIQFNDNGSWSWLQDERAVVDTSAGKFIIGSVASGGSRQGHHEAVIYDIATGDNRRYTLGITSQTDDQDAPALIIRPDGKYAAMWAIHGEVCLSYSSVFDGSMWSAPKTYDWTKDGCYSSSADQDIRYANPWYLSSEDKVYSGVRAIGTNPAFLASADWGSSWNYYGQISASSTLGAVAGDFKYWGNGTDRIDFVGTEGDPRDKDTSLWHGYYKGGKLYDSFDQVIDDRAGDRSAQTVSKFTRVFASGTTPTGMTGMKLSHLWIQDLVRYADGTIAMTGQGRSADPLNAQTRRMIYSRWDGRSWKTTYLVKAGFQPPGDDEDYMGLSALHPDDPNVIFVSSTYDPRTDLAVPSSVHEIFMGVTCDQGASWRWAPLTENSLVDNIRPIVPKWDSTHTLLLWLRGFYETSQSYDLEVVGTTGLLGTH